MKNKIKQNLNTIQNMCFDISETHRTNFSYSSGLMKLEVSVLDKYYNLAYHKIIYLNSDLAIENLQNLINELKNYL